jgi:hypothetical protein
MEPIPVIEAVKETQQPNKRKTYTEDEIKAATLYAVQHGDVSACNKYSGPQQTINGWRQRYIETKTFYNPKPRGRKAKVTEKGKEHEQWLVDAMQERGKVQCVCLVYNGPRHFQVISLHQENLQIAVCEAREVDGGREEKPWYSKFFLYAWYSKICTYPPVCTQKLVGRPGGSPLGTEARTPRESTKNSLEQIFFDMLKNQCLFA